MTTKPLLLFASILACTISLLDAQPSLTTVSQLITDASGNPFTGQVTITAQAMSSGSVIVRSRPIQICSSPTTVSGCLVQIVNGVLTVQLAANDTAAPANSSYFVEYQPTRGTPYTETWVVPTGGPYAIRTTATGPCISGSCAAGVLVPTTLSPGYIIFNWRGAWSSSTNYNPYDIVSSGGSSYVAIATNTNELPPNATYWNLLAGGGTGPEGPAGPAGSAGAAGNTLLSGSSSPSGGNNGDFYLETSNTCLYGPKASGAWPMVCTPLVGAAGSAGAAATVTIGTTTTGSPGSNASVTNVGTSSAALLNFTVPAGATGPTGLTPTGTGFPHITGGSLDSAARELLSTDIPNNTASAGSLNPNPGSPGGIVYGGELPLVTLNAPGSSNLAFEFPGASGTFATLANTETFTNKTIDGLNPTGFGYLVNITSDAQAQINSKQPTITTGSSSQYFKGDLSLGSLAYQLVGIAGASQTVRSRINLINGAGGISMSAADNPGTNSTDITINSTGTSPGATWASISATWATI